MNETKTIKKPETNTNHAAKDSVQKSEHASMQVLPKLEMTEPGYQYEREADSVADFVMRKVTSGESEPVTHAPSKFVSRVPFSHSSITVSPALEASISSSKGSGFAMPSSLRSSMEAGFGSDFSGVRFHTDSAASNMASNINAKAFTHGQDIYFNTGQYHPDTSSGQRLIAHELTHSLQQGNRVARDDWDDNQPYYTENMYSHNRLNSNILSGKNEFSKPSNYIFGAVYKDKRIPLFHNLGELMDSYENAMSAGLTSSFSTWISGKIHNIENRLSKLGEISLTFDGVTDKNKFLELYSKHFGVTFNEYAINEAEIAASKYADAALVYNHCIKIIEETEFKRNRLFAHKRPSHNSITAFKEYLSSSIHRMIGIGEAEITRIIGKNYSFSAINDLYKRICEVVRYYKFVLDNPNAVDQAFIKAYGSEYGTIARDVETVLSLSKKIEFGINTAVAIAINFGAAGIAEDVIYLGAEGTFIEGTISGVMYDAISGTKPNDMSEAEYLKNSVMSNFGGSALGAVTSVGLPLSEGIQNVALGFIVTGMNSRESMPLNTNYSPTQKAEDFVKLYNSLYKPNPTEMLRTRFEMLGFNRDIINSSDSIVKFIRETESSWYSFSEPIYEVLDDNKIPFYQEDKISYQIITKEEAQLIAKTIKDSELISVIKS